MKVSRLRFPYKNDTFWDGQSFLCPKARSTVMFFQCGPRNKLKYVQELSPCTYKFVVDVQCPGVSLLNAFVINSNINKKYQPSRNVIVIISGHPLFLEHDSTSNNPCSSNSYCWHSGPRQWVGWVLFKSIFFCIYVLRFELFAFNCREHTSIRLWTGEFKIRWRPIPIFHWQWFPAQTVSRHGSWPIFDKRISFISIMVFVSLLIKVSIWGPSPESQVKATIRATVWRNITTVSFKLL